MRERSNLVVKSNRLIEASYRLSLIEQQLILFTIVQARENQTGLFPDAPCTIRVADFAKAYGVEDTGGNLYGQLRSAVKNLFHRVVTVYDTDPETQKPRVTETRWISKHSRIDGAGHVQVTFTPDMIPHITRLENEFTSYRLEKVGKLSSIYSIRLYELLIQYLDIGKRDIEVAWLRNHFKLEETYPMIADLKRNVIDKAIRQINKHTDIKVAYSQIKTGRNVTGFSFTIKKNIPKNTGKPKLPFIDQAFIEKNAKVGESYQQAKDRLFAERAAAKKTQQSGFDFELPSP
jgi:plasmid replication initiation protein